MSFVHGMVIGMEFADLRDDSFHINQSLSRLLIVSDCFYILFFLTALVIFYVSLRKLKRLLHEHSGTGTDRWIAFLHCVMIAFLLLARLLSDLIELLIWFDLLGVEVISKENFFDNLYAIKGLIYDFCGTGATLILIFMVWRFTLMQVLGKNE